MVNPEKLDGWILSEDALRCLPRDWDDAKEYFVSDGVEKATIWICEYCREGFHRTEKEAEECCKNEN